MSQALVEQMKAMQRFFSENGMKAIYSDELCGRLLAYAALSGSEDVVVNPALNAAVQVAGDSFNLRGGEVPKMDKLPFWRRAMHDLRDKGCASDWWPAFAERYHIDPRRFPILNEAFKAHWEYFKGPLLEELFDDTANAAVDALKKKVFLREDDEPVQALVMRAPLREDDDDEPPSVVLRAPVRED